MRLHRIRKCRVISAAIVLAVFFISLTALAETRQGLTLISSSPLERTYEWQAPDWEWQQVIIDGQTCLRPGASVTSLWSYPGEPLLPMEALHFDLEIGQSAVITLVDSLFITKTVAFPLCPAPSSDPETGNLVYSIGPMEEHSGLLPERVWQSAMGEVRGRRILAVSLFPVQYAPQQRTLRLLQYARLTIRVVSPEPRLLRTLSPSQPIMADTPLAKIYLHDEGPYTVTGADLASAGVSLSGISPQYLRLYHRGIEQPIEVEEGGDGRFDAGDRFVFYGRFRRGTSEYYDAYSDTNVYFLASGDQPGLRYSEMSVTSAIATAADAFPDTLHFEQDLSYYAGDSDKDIHNTERVAGEGWFWSLLNKGGSATLGFTVPSPAAGSDSALLRVRLRGTTLDAHTPDHHVTIALNGTQVYERWFNDREELIAEAKCAVSLLRDGGNTLTVRLLADGPSERSQVYVDWLEIAYGRALAAREGWLNFTPPATGEKNVFVAGFADSTITAWDLSKQRLYRPQHVGKQWRNRLSIHSGGYFDGNTARLFRDGKEAAAGYRGHNLWRIDPHDGRLLEIRNFDTYGSKAQADSMAAWIKRLPEGALIAAAIRDEGSVSMNEAAHLALEALGSALTRNVGTRDSWALLGRKGAAPGSVPEVLQKSQSGPAIIESVLVFPEGASAFSTGMILPADAGKEMIIFSEKGIKKPPRLSRFVDAGLISGGSGADYLIVTHPLFAAQAKRLAAYRAAQNGWRTKVVLIEDIYDAFNEGLADPAALRTFLLHARENWTKPAPAFVLLFGDASWDPKNNLRLATPTEFVPTHGNPVSDSWFGCLDGPGDLLPDLHIGRIPVQNVAQAESSVDKIIAYEAAPSAEWKKDFLFISGGFDFLEQSQFSQQTASLINQFVVTPPVYGQATALNKTLDGLEEGEHRQDILDAVNDGVAWVNFIGHAGSRTWDLMFHNVDIDALSNSPRFPFVTSMTCHTGRFAEPNQDAFGEHFLMVEDKGAIAFMGTSGWGYSYEDYTFLCKIFPTALTDTVRYLSEIIDAAKLRLWTDAGTDPQVHDMLYQYNLLGDPAIKLAVPEKPDMAVQPADLSVFPDTPSEADSTAQIQVRVHNYGLVTRDSVEVQLLFHHPDLGVQRITPALKLPPLGRIDSVRCNWKLHNLAGALDLSVQIDPGNKIKEVEENNNSTQRSVTVLSSQIQLLSPAPFSLLPATKAIIKLDGTNLESHKDQLYRVQIDTSINFSSEALISHHLVNSSPPVFDWQPDALKSGQVYFLRVSDSTNDPGFWQASSFKTSSLTEIGWRQEGAYGFAQDGKNQVQSAKTVALASLPFPLYAESAAYSDGNFARILIGNEPAIQPHRGHNMVVVDPITFTIESSRTYDTYADSSAANNMAAMIERLAAGKLVLAAIMDEGTVSMTERAYRALESIGSAQCRSISPRSSWAIIGRKGAPKGSVPEAAFRPTTGSAVVTDTLHYFAPLGSLTSPRIGPAAAWRSLRAEAEVPQNGDLTLSLLGQRRNSTVWDTLRTGLAANRDHDLTAISARTWPYLQLVARLSTGDRLHSPRLHAWQVLHDPAPDLALSPAFLTLSADSVLSGRPVVLNLGVFNIGLASADSISLSFTETAPGSGEKLFSRLLLPKPLAADQNVTIDQLYTPSGKPGSRLLTIRVDGDNTINELSESNNALTVRLQVVADTLKPEIAVTFDGRTIATGDWVGACPVILARLIDDSPLALTDTLRVNLLLDGERVPFGDGQLLRLLAPPDTSAAALLKFTPQLSEGDHRLEILFSDGSGNLASAGAEFGVASSIQLQRVMNYPNPLRENTDFTFELTQAAEVRIRIYTVNGRLIRTLEGGSLGAGFNRLFWDGRDGDGDPLANGVYLYRIDAVSGTERTQVIEKCIVMR